MITEETRKLAATEMLTKRSRYKDEPKKPWIYAYYALIAGGQKRRARIEREKVINKVERIDVNQTDSKT